MSDVQKGTGAKLYSRPRTLASTGAKVPVAPVESAPMILWTMRFYYSACIYPLVSLVPSSHG